MDILWKCNVPDHLVGIVGLGVLINAGSDSMDVAGDWDSTFLPGPQVL